MNRQCLCTWFNDCRPFFFSFFNSQLPLELPDPGAAEKTPVLLTTPFYYSFFGDGENSCPFFLKLRWGSGCD
jgi:hypothetical protein